MRIKNGLVLWLLVLSGLARAEQGCPDGYVPVFQGGTQNRTCVVDYNLPVWQEQNQGSAQSVEQWENRWGAIAVDDDGAVVGVAADQASESAAQSFAMQDCRSRGGAACDVKIAYYNQCAALVAADVGYHTYRAPTLQVAERDALGICRREGMKNCRVYYSGCSLPVRIQ